MRTVDQGSSCHQALSRASVKDKVWFLRIKTHISNYSAQQRAVPIGFLVCHCRRGAP